MEKDTQSTNLQHVDTSLIEATLALSVVERLRQNDRALNLALRLQQAFLVVRETK